MFRSAKLAKKFEKVVINMKKMGNEMAVGSSMIFFSRRERREHEPMGTKNGLKKHQKLHCGVNLFALRCGYRRTAVEKNLDCGAFFDELLQANEPKIFVIKFNVVSLRR